jgi:hypothetical protein
VGADQPPLAQFMNQPRSIWVMRLNVTTQHNQRPKWFKSWHAINE